MNNEDIAFRQREKLLDEPPEHHYCAHCGGEIHEIFTGDESVTMCVDCKVIEPEEGQDVT